MRYSKTYVSIKICHSSYAIGFEIPVQKPIQLYAFQCLPGNHLVNNSFNYIKTLDGFFFFLMFFFYLGRALPPARFSANKNSVTVPSNEASTSTEPTILYGKKRIYLIVNASNSVTQQTHSLPHIGVEPSSK